MSFCYFFLKETSSGPILMLSPREVEASVLAMIMDSGLMETGTPFTWRTTVSTGFLFFSAKETSSGPMTTYMPSGVAASVF